MQNLKLVITYLVNLSLAIVAFIIGFRLMFKLFAANPQTPFVSWIYSISDYFINPFRGIFPSQTIQSSAILDVPALISLVMYAFLAYLIVATIDATATNLEHTNEHISHHQPHYH